MSRKRKETGASEDVWDAPVTTGQRVAGGCAALVLASLVTGGAWAAHPYAALAVVAVALGVWVRVNERRIAKSGHQEVTQGPLPSPTVLAEGDWVSADGSRVYRKRGHGNGYDVEETGR